MITSKFVRLFAFLCVFVTSTLALAGDAGTRVDILPRKILMEDKQRSSEITVMNLGHATGDIRLSIIGYKQDENGNYQNLDQPLNPAFDPQKLVRFSPKQFSLPPGGRQKVRISVQKPSDLPDGEYRFHVKALSYNVDGKQDQKPERGQSMEIKMNIAVVIPVIVRKGNLSSTAKIENVRFNPSKDNQYGAATLDFDLTRTGQAGVLGVVDAYWDVAGQPSEKIARVSNVNVFSEVQKRHMQIPLNKIPEGSGTMRLVFSNEFGDRGVIDEVVLQK